MMTPSNQRRTHRKRVSALRLSSDTTSTLPEYISSTGWHRPEYTENIPSDTPPDYPDSAEEADEDTDTDANTISYVPHTTTAASTSPRAHTASPRRPKRFQQTHKRRHSTQLYSQAQSNDSYLDSLLERSVHALEMSNTLLESSISTSTSLSAVLADDSRADSTLETRALNLSSRIRGNWDVQASWSGDLNEITRRVEVLFGDEEDARFGGGGAHSREGTGVSCSLPNSTSPPPHLHRPRRRPSLDLQQKSESAVPRLHYSQQDRSRLIAPPPRALTQYVGSTQDPEAIILPSTLGLRCPSSFHEHRTFYETASSSTTSLHSTPSLPKLNDKPLEPSTPAYNMLSSFVARAPSSSSTPSSNFTSSFRRGSSSASSSSTEPRNSRSPHKSPDRARQDACRKGHRPMTPPTEESSSSDGCIAKQTILSLRKILDDQPQPTRSKLPPAPAFLPRTPAPVADAATSTATASISRLFTKGTHSSSTRPPSPPRHSSMKRTSSANPSPSPTVLSIPDMLSVFGGGSTPSSGRSTPKRISFAALPESYISTRPEGSLTKFNKQKQRRRKRGAGTTVVGEGKGKEGEEGAGWWSGWLLSGGGGVGGTPHGLTMSLARQEERVQDRVTRNWSGRGYGGGLDEWAV